MPRSNSLCLTVYSGFSPSKYKTFERQTPRPRTGRPQATRPAMKYPSHVFPVPLSEQISVMLPLAIISSTHQSSDDSRLQTLGNCDRSVIRGVGSTAGTTGAADLRSDRGPSNRSRTSRQCLSAHPLWWHLKPITPSWLKVTTAQPPVCAGL